TPGEQQRPGVAIGPYILDLPAVANLLDEEWRDDLAKPVLNAWRRAGPPTIARFASGCLSC
ncbi:MAG TPA: hypothetical protein VD768_04580, partial [Sphingomicrobium sp.]|nr:hypothetical protein [Sphingomicrobium sp.]